MLRVVASVILLLCAIKSQESNASVLPSVTPVHQQEPNPSPVPTQQLRFPAGRTKNVDSNTESDDYSICFPYFISQDIESLLAQAIRMLDRVDEGRQKSWLLVFVQKLDSLSRQLQSLPVKHRNMCFQKNHQQNLQSEEEEEEEYGEHPVESYPDVIPDDVQLHNARNFFDGRVDHPRQRNGHEQYVTGKVFDRMHPGLVQRHSTKRFNVEDHNLHRQDDGPSFTEPVHATGTDVPKSRESEELSGRPAIPASIRFTAPLIPSDRDDEAANPLDREMVPAGFKPVSSMTMTYENMPFLPRSTRKGMPRQLADKLRYHPHQSKDRENDLHNQQLVQQSSSPPTTTEPFLQSRTLVGPDDVTNGGTAAGDHNHPQLRQQVNENNHEQAHQSPDSKKSVADDKASTGIATEAHPEPAHEDDEVVNQLHSGAEAMRHEDRPDRKITDSSNPIYSRVPLTRQQSQMEGEAAHPEQRINSEEHRDDFPRNYGKYDYRQIPYHYDNNNLDFEYEDQGAAAGELYAEEDSNSARLLAVPPPPKVADNDEAVRQLHELKSSITDQHHQRPGSTSSNNNNNNQMQTSQAYPTETSKLEQRDVRGHH